ncbi:hypothetical protein VDGL01_12660, partial [Verticillium dahliae]
MAVLAVDPPTFLALDHALNDHDFQKSRTLLADMVISSYNGLESEEDQPPVEDQHIQDLAALFVRHRAEKTLGIHLIHGHFQIPEGTVMVGTKFQDPDMRWAKTTDIKKLKQSSVHGHIFVLVNGGLC